MSKPRKFCPASMQSSDQGSAKLMPDRRGGCSCAAPPASARWRCSRAATSSTGRRRRTCCDVISSFNDRVRRCCLVRDAGAGDSRESASPPAVPFNAYYARTKRPTLTATATSSRCDGRTRSVDAVGAQYAGRYRKSRRSPAHVCVEGWSAIGSWQGIKLSDFLKLIGADTRAKYVWSSARRATRTTSTCRRRCIRNATHRSNSITRPCRAPTASRSKSASDQARLQESQIRHSDVGTEQRRRRLLGEPGL